MPYDGGHGDNASGSRIDLSVNESLSFWVQYNECNFTPKRNISESGNIIIDYYLDGRDGSEVVLVTITNGEHSWPGSDKDLNEDQEINGTEIIWEFFDSHPKQ